MSEIFPPSLPAVRYDGYSHFPTAANTRRHNMTSKRPRQLRAYAHDRTACEVNWRFTRAQFKTFCEFFRLEDVGSGAEYFETELAFGQGLQTVNARFLGGMYKHRLTHPHVDVMATLEVEEVPLLSEEDLDALIIIGDLDGLEAMVQDLHIFIHETYPELFPE
jgi:hypothetical protein